MEFEPSLVPSLVCQDGRSGCVDLGHARYGRIKLGTLLLLKNGDYGGLTGFYGDKWRFNGD